MIDVDPGYDDPSEEQLLQSLHDEIAAHEETKAKLVKADRLRLKALHTVMFVVERDQEFRMALRPRFDGSLMKFCSFCMKHFTRTEDAQAHIEKCAKHPLAIERRAHEETKAKLADAVMHWRAADTRLMEAAGDEAEDVDPELGAYLEAERKEHEQVKARLKTLENELIGDATRVSFLLEELHDVKVHLGFVPPTVEDCMTKDLPPEPTVFEMAGRVVGELNTARLGCQVLEGKLEMAEARAAAMRAALEQALPHIRPAAALDGRGYVDIASSGDARGAVKSALAPDAGRVLLAELEALRELEAAVRIVFPKPADDGCWFIPHAIAMVFARLDAARKATS
jgi:hypothetical protein